jgi:hypothetical protein
MARAWWRGAALAAVAFGLAIVSACGPSNPAPPVSGNTPSPTGSLAQGGAPPTKTAKPAPTFPSEAGAYTAAALAAWVAKDVQTLDQYEDSGGQLHTMLTCDGCYNTAFTPVGCSGAAGSSYCLYFNTVGDELRLRVNNSLLGQPRAMGTGSIFNQIIFPSDNKAYAQEALDAWQTGDDARLKLLTAKPFTSAQVTALGANKAGSWTFDHSEGAAGSSYYSFSNGSGHSLAFRFTNGPIAPTTGPTSQHRITDIVYL